MGCKNKKEGCIELRDKFRIVTFTIATIICLMVIYLHLLSHQKTQEIYLDQTEKIITDLKKDFLKDTVNNVFLEIDKLRQTKNKNYKNNTESVLRRFQEDLESTDEEFIKLFSDKFNGDLSTEMWTAFLWNNETENILYSTSNFQGESIDDIVKDLKSSLGTYAPIKKGNIEGVFGVSKVYIDDLVKKEIGEIIKNREFSSDSYMWINEIVNYEGGKDYAIRKVHPSLGDTEETYLSTDIEDVKGNLPYLEELEGVKKNGELFFNYYFKKLNSDQISEKITYAKLYKDYDWIIAMGVHLDNIDAYAEETNKAIYSLSTESIIRVLRYIFIVLLIGFLILYLLEKNHSTNTTKSLESEINYDTLTNAYSRRFGVKSLKLFYKEYLSEDEKAAIMMFDIDNFKDINDNYGHKVGDTVLVEMVKRINNVIRSSDQLIRWGGDEFVGILPGLKEEHMMELGKKILDEVTSLEIPVENGTIRTTISIGFSYFRDTDSDYNDVLKRIDDAMYESKKKGKNKVTIIL